ncbi:hypothetical protein ACSLO3_27735, partial [Escherichia coli]
MAEPELITFRPRARTSAALRAINYLKSKGYQITWDWEEMWQEAHARAFTVAKVTRLDILED